MSRLRWMSRFDVVFDACFVGMWITFGIADVAQGVWPAAPIHLATGLILLAYIARLQYRQHKLTKLSKDLEDVMAVARGVLNVDQAMVAQMQQHLKN